MPELAVRRCRPLLGTFVEIAVPEGCGGAIDAAFAAVAHVHSRMSFHEETSDLAALRRAPAGARVRIGIETVRVLRTAAMLHSETQGLFDVTVGARLVVAGFLPPTSGIDAAALNATAADIEIVDDEHAICHRPMLIDLGGIAKGFAVDRAIEVLALAGVESAIVNAGGELRVLGDAPQVVELRGADGTIEAVLRLASLALATSSNLHLRARANGAETSPHHGRERAVLADHAVSVVAPACIIADACTKIVLADPVLGAAVAERSGGAVVDRTPAAIAV